jgi:hypothetical protein
MRRISFVSGVGFLLSAPSSVVLLFGWKSYPANLEDLLGFLLYAAGSVMLTLVWESCPGNLKDLFGTLNHFLVLMVCSGPTHLTWVWFSSECGGYRLYLGLLLGSGFACILVSLSGPHNEKVSYKP